jgi:predicted Ser/Thr protein kinase
VACQGARELSTNWGRVGALFEEALELDAGGRERLLARTAETDPALASEVRALLRAHDTSSGFLEQPAWAVAPELLAEQPGEGALAGTRVGPYQVQEEVGRGGMGVVYAARDERLGRTVALKVLPKAVSRDAKSRERLAREARAAAALSHPSIATIYALEEIDGELYLSSELVRGATLRRMLASGAPPEARVVEILLQLAGALDAAHRHGIVHRDLKPENVLVAPDGRIKVVDFGIARHLNPPPGTPGTLTVTGMALGTLGYMAPEQLRGEEVDARADVFAFGIIAYELATGQHPFGGSDPASLLERLVTGPSPLARTLQPAGLDTIVRRCLAGDRARRFTSGTDLLEALTTAMQSPAATVPLPMTGTAWWWKFHQVAVATLTIIATIVVGYRKPWIGAAGSWVFLAVLILATITTTLRLHLWFVSQVHPGSLIPIRARVLRWLVIAESLLIVILLGFGFAITWGHEWTATHMIVTAMLLLLSLIVIEPATTRASLP